MLDRGDNLLSPELQDSLQERVLGHEFELVDYPAELDVSGAKSEREVLDRIIADLDAGLIDGLAVARLDRLARLKLKERAELLERIEGAGGIIKSASEPVDSSTPAGRMMRDQFFGYARMQWEQLAEGWQLSKAAAIADGKAIKSRRPYGYRFDADHRLVVDEEEAAVVVELFERRRDGASWDELVVWFEQRTGIKRSRGGFPSMLSNRVYLGELHYGELSNLEAHDAIVEVELFDAVQATTARRRAGRGAAVNQAKSLLAGIAKCANCGAGLGWTKSNGDGPHIYRCQSRARECSARAHIRASVLDAYVVEQVLAQAGAAADVERGATVSAGGDRARVEYKLAEARTALSNYVGDVDLELELGHADYRAGITKRAKRVEALERELAELGEADELVEAWSTVRAELTGENPDSTVEDRRQLLASVIAEVKVTRTPYRGAPAEERASILWRD